MKHELKNYLKSREFQRLWENIKSSTYNQSNRMRKKRKLGRENTQNVNG